MLFFIVCVLAAFVFATLVLSIVSLFLKSTKRGQKIAIGVSLLALLILCFLPLVDVLWGEFNGVTIIKSLFDDSFVDIIGLLGGSEWIPLLFVALLLAPVISLAMSSFFQNGGVIGGILMLCATTWLLSEISAMYLVKIGVGTYIYAFCAVLICFTPLFNEKSCPTDKECSK